VRLGRHPGPSFRQDSPLPKLLLIWPVFYARMASLRDLSASTSRTLDVCDVHLRRSAMRVVIALSFLAVLFLAMATTALAETKALHREQSQILHIRLGSNDGPTDGQCDTKGNVFITVSDPAGEDPSDRPLLMFDSAGVLKTKFASSRKDLGLSRYEDHFEPTALLPNGGVARLVWSKDALSVARFSADGRLESRTALDSPAILPYQFVVFPSGELLVSGLEHVHSRRAFGAYKSFSAIYDPHGHLLRRLSFPEDAEIDAAAEVGDSRYAHGPMFGNRGISSGKARMGSDGNVYLMRRTSPATVYVISASGELVRTLKIEPENVGQMPSDMQIADGRIAIEFSLHCSSERCEGVNFTIADATTGQKLADYADNNVYGDFACYIAKPERFTFLITDDGKKLQMVQAAAK
jgi:hypothetical protein